MARRVIEVPPSVWSTNEQAAAWLGLTVAEFTREYLDFPDLLPWTEFGTSYRWYWLDLVRYADVRRFRQQPSKEQRDEAKKKRTEEKKAAKEAKKKQEKQQ